jgi:hypothetical protein
VLLVAAFGLLLASFPARNAELWAHLAAGRALVGGALERVSPTWLYDVGCYGVFQILGASGLVAVKAGLMAALGVVLVRASRTTGGWLIPVASTGLALLAVANRALLAPATVSYLLLALAARGAWRARGPWPGRGLVGLFLVWGNTDPWFVLGLAVVVLIRVGQWLDDRGTSSAGLLPRLGGAALLALAAALNPTHLAGYSLPAELGWGAPGAASGQALTTPFEWAYVSALGFSPAALAYYPLLGLSLASFLLLPGRRWERFLPWAGLAVLSAVQGRAVPFFAVVAGPVLAWNLQEFFARRPRPAFGPRVQAVMSALVGALAAVFLVTAWPGWLQRPPFEPRRWAVEPPGGLEQAAAAVRRGHAEGAWPKGSRTLHLSRDTAAAFAWFCPQDDGVLDPGLAAAAAGSDASAAAQLAAARIGRVVVHAADRGPALAVLTALFADSDRWPVLFLEGGFVIFGHRDPAGSGQPDPFRGREFDLDRLAFRPGEGDKAPAEGPIRRRWWDVFWKPAPPAAGDRDAARVLLLRAEVSRAGAPLRHLAAWEAFQAAALVAAAPGWTWPGGAADAAIRLTVLRPPVPGAGADYPPITRFTFDCQRLFALGRDDMPPSLLYAAVRAARRAVAASPADAGGYLVLGQSYLRLLTATRERVWALNLPQLAQLRQAQASAALNRAVTLNPGLAAAHLELGRLYQRVGYLDLALQHLRACREAVTDAELADLAAVVDRRLADFGPESVRARVADRARAALQRGLAGQARALLLDSDVSAFGPDGTQLELDLLLRTGRPDDVRDWTAPEVMGSVGAAGYHWLRTQALAAVGEYAAADGELAELAGANGLAPARMAGVFAARTGQALLAEQPAGLGLPALLGRALARFDFWAAVQQESAGLARRADATVLRGLLALEAGDVDGAQTAFRSVLAYAADPPAGSGLVLKCRSVAKDALGLLQRGGPGGPSPAGQPTASSDRLRP